MSRVASHDGFDVAMHRRDELVHALKLASAHASNPEGWVLASDVQAVFDEWERTSYGAPTKPVSIGPRLNAAYRRGEIERAWQPHLGVNAWRPVPTTVAPRETPAARPTPEGLGVGALLAQQRSDAD